ncbi:MAG: endonuclease MutS2, partial [bacterium]|nr:endonuclease MutS2 [bacterium]
MDKTRRLLGFPRILALLEYCAPSSLGKSLIATIRASDDPAEITRWLDEVTGVRELLESETAPPLDGLVDLREPLQALKRPGTIADPSFCLVLAEFLRAARRLKSYLLKRQESHLLIAEPFIDLEVPVHLAERVKKVLDSNGEIKDNASHDLKRLRRTLLRSRDELRVKMDEEARRLSADGTLQENVVTIRNGRYVLPVKVEKQGQFDGLVHDRSASGATMFMEPMSVVKANNNLIGLALEERAEMSRLMLEISDHIRAETDSLGWVIEVLGRFEVIVAKASLSQMMEAVAVKVVPEGEVDLLQARHPLLGSKAVPQDIRMDARCHTLIITGQNAGGKTVTLKTLGLLAIMLTFGLHLPCHADSRLSVFREIHADIGDEQSLERDLSTFSAHLEHLKIILARPGGPDCLVLLDELGDGTDPREGAALAVSVAR